MNSNGILKVDEHEKPYVLAALKDVGLAYQVMPLNRNGFGGLLLGYRVWCLLCGT